MDSGAFRHQVITLNQCWLIISKVMVQRHSPDEDFARHAQNRNPKNVQENYTYKNEDKSPRFHWVTHQNNKTQKATWYCCHTTCRYPPSMLTPVWSFSPWSSFCWWSAQGCVMRYQALNWMQAWLLGRNTIERHHRNCITGIKKDR